MTKLVKLTFTMALVFVAITAFSFQKETRKVDSFDRISLGTHADLYLKIGNKHSVVLDGDREDLERITTEVSDGRLKIENKKNNNWNYRSNKIKVYVTMPSVKGIRLSGSGDLIGESKINADDLSVSISGSGSVSLDVDSDDFEFTISGSGSADITGSARKFDARISGSGSIDAADFTAKDAGVRISGSGSMKLDVTDELDVRIGGSGNVYYTGNPRNVDAHSSGSGKVRKRG